MKHVLVVDDSATDRALAGGLLQKTGVLKTSFAANGREALDAVRRQPPDVIITDLQMPEMNGLELVQAVKEEFPSVPVVLMTARGSEEIATEALRRGAASYVPKGLLAAHLNDTVQRLLSAARADRMHSRLMHSLESGTVRFRLRNDPELFDPLVAHLQEMLRCLPLGDESERLRVGLAVKHGLAIAHHHGNLEVPVANELTDRQFEDLARRRRLESPYSERSLAIEATVSSQQFLLVVQHEGCGIDPQPLTSDVERDGRDRSWQRGFVLLPSIMDEVDYGSGSDRIRLLKSAVLDSDMELEASDVTPEEEQ